MPRLAPALYSRTKSVNSHPSDIGPGVLARRLEVPQFDFLTRFLPMACVFKTKKKRVQGFKGSRVLFLIKDEVGKSEKGVKSL
jgi:hypothetical protein